MTTEDHSDDIALAGEYALHLLDAEQRRAFETRMQTEPHLRELVRDWDEHFAPLAEQVTPVAPPARVKAAIDARLFPAAARKRGGVWGWLLGAGVATAVLVGAFVVVPQLTVPDPSFVAQVQAEDRSLVVLASYTPETATLRIDRRAGGPAPGRVLELWLIAEGAPAPVSLGVLPDPQVTQIRLPDALAAQISGGTLAISDEPPGGSPTGAPTGAVLAVGPVTPI